MSVTRDQAYFDAVESELGTRNLDEANRRTRMIWEWERELRDE